MGLGDLLGWGRYADLTLGVLVGRWGRWRGQIVLGVGPAVPLTIAGGWRAPAEARLHLARELAARYETLRPTIGSALFEHYAPYAEAIPTITQPDQVWPHVSVVRVLIEPMAGVDTVEIAYRAAWDEEHVLGARVQAWRLVELNGSIRA